MKTVGWKERRKITIDQMLERLQEIAVEDTAKDDFLKALVRMHKTAKEKDVFAVSSDQYIVRCYACDGSLGRIWRAGDPEYSCVIWNRAQELGLTDGL